MVHIQQTIDESPTKEIILRRHLFQNVGERREKLILDDYRKGWTKKQRRMIKKDDETEEIKRDEQDRDVII